MSRSPASRFAQNALLLIAVNLLMRTVGVSFNVYLSNRAGGEVMGLFSLLSGVYTFALTLGCGGINLGTTRMVADALGHGNGDEGSAQREIRACLRRCLLYSLCFGAATCVLLWISAPTVGCTWLGDNRTVSSLRVMALTLPPVALTSCMSGYFTAMRHVTPNAAVGILTQVFRIGGCTYLMSLWLGKGAEAICMALVLGGGLSEVAAFLMTWLAYGLDRRRRSRRLAGISDPPHAAPPRGLGKKLVSITLPVTLSACIRSGLVTLQHMLIPKGLKASGADWSQALSAYGTLHSMVLPVVLFPSAFISSFSSLLVPEIAESRAAGDMARVARISRRIIQPALFFSFGVAGIMSCFSHQLGMLLYNSPEAGVYIRQLAPLIPIMYVDSSVDAVLKGMGEQVYSMNVNIVDALCSVIMVVVLLPSMGLQGYVVTIYVTETLNTTLSLTRMLRVSHMRVCLKKQVFGPLLCVLGATSVLQLSNRVLSLPYPDSTPRLIGYITVTAVLYIALSALCGIVGREEFLQLKGLIPHRSRGTVPEKVRKKAPHP